MAITHVGTQTDTASNGTSVVITKPAGTVAGDVLLAIISCNNQNVTPPSGWVQLFDSSSGVFRCQAFYKLAGGSEPSSYTFSIPSAAPMVGSVSCYDGVDQTTPFEVSDSSTSTTHAEPYTTPSLDGTFATSGYLLYVRAVRYSSSGTVPTFTASSVSERTDVGVFSGGSVAYAHALYQAVSVYSGGGTLAGLPITCSVSESDNVVATLALKGETIPGSFDFSIASLPQASMSGTISINGATLDATLPFPDVTATIILPNEGALGAVVTPSMDFSVITEPRGPMDVQMPLQVDLVAETRRFTGNVYVVPPEFRWVVVHQTHTEFVDGKKTHRELEIEAQLQLPVVNITAHADVGTEPMFSTAFPLEPKIGMGGKPTFDGSVAGTAYTPEMVLIGFNAGEVPPSSWDLYDPQITTTYSAEGVTALVIASDASSALKAFAGHAPAIVAVGDAKALNQALVELSAAAFNPVVRIASPAEDVSVRIGPIKGESTSAAGTAFSPMVMNIPQAPMTVVAHNASIATTFTGDSVLALALEQNAAPHLPLPVVQFTVQRTVVVYAVNIGDNVNSSFTVTHNLGTRDVLTGVYEAASPYAEVLPTSVERTTTDTVTVTFPFIPTAGQYRVVVVYG